MKAHVEENSQSGGMEESIQDPVIANLAGEKETVGLRLLYVTASLPYLYQLEEFFVPELKHLERKGIDITMLPRSPRGALMSDLSSFKVLTTELLSPRALWSGILMALQHPIAVSRAVREVVRGIPFRSACLNLLCVPKAMWASRWAQKLRIDHVHAQWCSTPATIAYLIHRLTGIPWSMTVHRGEILQNSALESKMQSASFVRVIGLSSCKLLSKFCDTERGNIDILHMGIEVPPLLSQPAAARRSILCPARLLPVKGHKYLLEAAAILVKRSFSFSLTLAGDGPLVSELKELSNRLGLADHVHFAGQVVREDLLSWYTTGRVGLVVLPSCDLGGGVHEGIPVALMEAMAHGIPVISTTTGGIPELLENGAGVMVPPGDPAALADAIERVLADDGLYLKLRHNGYERVYGDFNIDSVATRVSNLFRAFAQVPHGEGLR